MKGYAIFVTCLLKFANKTKVIGRTLLTIEDYAAKLYEITAYFQLHEGIIRIA